MLAVPSHSERCLRSQQLASWVSAETQAVRRVQEDPVRFRPRVPLTGTTISGVPRRPGASRWVAGLVALLLGLGTWSARAQTGLWTVVATMPVPQQEGAADVLDGRIYAV